MTNEMMDTRITELDLIEAQIKSLKAAAEIIKEDLKAEMDARKVDMVDTGVNRIWYDAYTKRTVDTKALKADGMYDKYSKEQTVVTFKITKCTNN